MECDFQLFEFIGSIPRGINIAQVKPHTITTILFKSEAAEWNVDNLWGGCILIAISLKISTWFILILWHEAFNLRTV